MTLHRRAARRDVNEGEIIDALRQAGSSVVQLSIKGCADLLVGRYNVRSCETCGRRHTTPANYLIEVKGAKGQLTEDEVTFHQNWLGQIAVARTIDEALRIVGAKE